MEDLSVKEIKKIENIINKSKKEKKVKRKWRFTEKIIFLVLLYAISIFERGSLYAFKNQAESMWAYLLPAIGVLASSAFAVFVWKEKNENLPKIMANPNYDQEQLEEQMRYELEEEFRNLGR